MSKFQRLVVRIWLAIVIVTALFPPGIHTGREATVDPDGHKFLFSTARTIHYPYTNQMRIVDTGRLLAYWGLVSGVAGLAFLCPPRKRPKPEPRRPGIDPPSEFPGVGTPDSEST